jgi:hypothetical protein
LNCEERHALMVVKQGLKSSPRFKRSWGCPEAPNISQ